MTKRKEMHMSKRKARPGDRIVVRSGPDNGRIADVVETDDGLRVRVVVVQTNNNIVLGWDEWEWPSPA